MDNDDQRDAAEEAFNAHLLDDEVDWDEGEAEAIVSGIETALTDYMRRRREAGGS